MRKKDNIETMQIAKPQPTTPVERRNLHQRVGDLVHAVLKHQEVSDKPLALTDDDRSMVQAFASTQKDGVVIPGEHMSVWYRKFRLVVNGNRAVVI